MFRAVDEPEDEGIKQRLQRQGEEALGKLAEELAANPLVTGALQRAFEAREKAVAAQNVAMGALNIPSAADIERLTRLLLDFARARLGGGITLEPRRGDMRELLQKVTHEFRVAYPDRGVTTTLLAPRAPIRADYNAVRSVIQNLLENALKYSPARSEVTLEIRAASEEIVLRVADRGIGIEAADLKRIFEKFYRAGDEMTRRTRGSGLGLALVKRIVDAHGASIRVASKPGEGTEMTIVFARAEGGMDAPHTDR